MRIVEPEVFILGETRIDEDGLKAFLEHIGAPDWQSDAPTDSEKLIEMYGRLCYESFRLGLNPNIVKIRPTNLGYITNVKEKGDGSILEHATVNFVFCDVSRVFTHELVRHRAGVAISQESLRFVRLTDLGLWMPTVIKEDDKVTEIFVRTFKELECLQKELASYFGLDNRKDFESKKLITSAMRRLAPDGLATNIGWTANMRTIRHVIEMRTHPSAEEEIRFVFGKVAELMIARYPNLFSDYEVEMVDGLPWYKTPNKKV